VSLRRLASVLVLFLAVGASPAHAQEDTSEVVPSVAADISPALDDIEVDGLEYRAVAADYEAARDTREAAAARLVDLRVEERDLASRAARAGAAERLAEGETGRWVRRVRALAVRAYIGATGDDDALRAGLDPGYTLPERRQLLTAEVDANWRAALADARHELDVTTRRHDDLTTEHDDVADEQVRTQQTHDTALAEERRLHPTVLQARATATVVGSDLTLVALDAYLRAAMDTSSELPGCGLPWWLLAGIGRVESGHGTFSTSVLDPAGTARPSIIGIPLNGGNSTAVITDTDGGELDGDLTHDRAVGPMQFIPSTWARYAADGNDDGLADPQNLYDAAHAAATYLCTAGGDLTTDAGIRQAILSYNHSNAYVTKVLSFTTDYVNLLA
jgi:membrane-bound lytic murein transglycosylase B